MTSSDSILVLLRTFNRGASEPNSAETDRRSRWVQSFKNVLLAGKLVDDSEHAVGELLLIKESQIENADPWCDMDPYAQSGLYASADKRLWKAIFKPSDPLLKTTFVAICTDKQDMVERRKRTRPDHVAWWNSSGKNGYLGPCPAPDGNGVVGSMIIADGESIEEMRKWTATDPYNIAGLFSSVQIFKMEQNPLEAVNVGPRVDWKDHEDEISKRLSSTLMEEDEGRMAGENANPNAASNALGSLISSRLKESHGTVAALVNRLEENMSSTNTSDTLISTQSEAADTFETRSDFPRTGPPMLEKYSSLPRIIVPETTKIADSEPNLRSFAAMDDVRTLQGSELLALKREAFGNAERATEADEAENYDLAHELYLLVVRQFMHVIPKANPEEQEKMSKTVEAVIKRIEELQEALREADRKTLVATRLETSVHSPADRVESSRDEQSRRDTGASPSVNASPSRAQSSVVNDDNQKSHSPMRYEQKNKSITKSLPKEHYMRELEMLESNIITIMTGGDQTGGGNGKSTALMMNMHITDLNAGTIGEMKRLEPLQEHHVAHWNRDMKLFIRAASNIFDRVAETKIVNGRPIEVMVDVQREDVRTNFPILQKNDERLQQIMASFKDLHNEVQYKKRDDTHNSVKWWIEQPVIRPGGLSQPFKAQMLNVYEEVGSIYKECHRINTKLLGEMEVPPKIFSKLPKHAKQVIGKELATALTDWRTFSIEQYLRERGAWDQTVALGFATRLEYTSLIWKMRLSQPGSLLDRFRKENRTKISCAQKRAETAVRTIKEKFPSMSQTKLDELKITHNSDIGKSVIEAYSRALESRAARIMERVKAILDADLEDANSLTK